MKFLFPYFLFALVAIAIPIIIHLFNFRRYKTVYFTNVQFLKEIKEETASRSKLKHWLILASRILAIAFLVFAFAQPYIPNKEQQRDAAKEKAVSVFIDNSFSMTANSDDRLLLEEAKSAAREIAAVYGPEVYYQILTNDFEGRHQRLIGQEEFLSLIDEVRVSAESKTAQEVFKRQKEALNKKPLAEHSAFIISDFQKTFVDLEMDTAVQLNLVTLNPQALANVSIDTAWLPNPIPLKGQSNQLIVQLQNRGNTTIDNMRLTLEVNGEVKPTNLSLPPNSIVQDTLGFMVKEQGWNLLEINIEDYPIVFDDQYFMVLNVVDLINVLEITGDLENNYLSSLYANDQLFSFESMSVNAIDYSVVSDQDLIILNNLKDVPSGLSAALTEMVGAGGNLIVFPSAEAQISSYNVLLQGLNADLISGLQDSRQEVRFINLEEGTFKDVFDRVPDNMDLPQTQLAYSFIESPSAYREVILGLEEQVGFVSKFTHESGLVYLCASPLDSRVTNLPVHAIFVPMMHKIAITGINTYANAATIDSDTRIFVRSADAQSDLPFQMEGESVSFIPSQTAFGNHILLGLQGQVKSSGHYRIYQENAEFEAYAGLNYDRSESEMSYFSKEEIESLYPEGNLNIVEGDSDSIRANIEQIDRGLELWKLCLILALIFLGVEIILLRLPQKN